jgi:hypothetical protein
MLVTYTDCENKWRSLQAAGHEVHVIQYDDRPHHRHIEIVEQVRAIAPDFTVWISAIEKYHGRPVPQPDIFHRLRAIAPLVHMCNDAADPPWWEMLHLYNEQNCFDVQVSIDGSIENPISQFKNGLLMLTPIDTRVFAPKPWAARQPVACLVGGLGHSERASVIQALQQLGILHFYPGPVGRSYEQMAEIMCSYRYVFCHPMTGSGTRTHVKGRVVETGFAGAALIEWWGGGMPPSRHWFDEDTEYFADCTIEDVVNTIQSDGVEAEQRAAKFHEHMVKHHHPRVFWDRVIQAAGINVGRTAA